jgi:hypothetical protein
MLHLQLQFLIVMCLYGDYAVKYVSNISAGVEFLKLVVVRLVRKFRVFMESEVSLPH